MKNFRYILVLLILYSCSSPTTQTINKDTNTSILMIKDTFNYHPDTLYTVKGCFPDALDAIKPRNRYLRDGITPADVVKNKVKAISYKKLFIFEFDKKGFIISERYWPGYYTSKFNYTFDKEGKPLTIAILDTNNMVVGTAKYKYDEKGKLVQAGNYVLKYNSNDVLKSIEDANEIERYSYDANNNLNTVHYSTKPGVVTCGNKLLCWRGKYNSNKQLIEEEFEEIPNGRKIYYQYASSGELIKSRTAYSMGKLEIQNYIYKKGLLNESRSLNNTDKLTDTSGITYDTYD